MSINEIKNNNLDRGKYSDPGAWEGVLFYNIAKECRGRVLELGRQNGQLATLISGVYGLEVEGFDLTSTNLPLPEHSFDTVIVSGILEWTDNPNKVLQEAIRLCQPTGQILVTAAKRELRSGQTRVFNEKSLTDLINLPASQLRFQDEIKDLWLFLKVKRDNNQKLIESDRSAVKQRDPKISIIIITYNREEYIAEAINSALQQTYKDFEIIVVDDGSTDKTREIVESFNSLQIRYLYKKNSGISEARNMGVKNARGEYILWLDSDDSLLPNAAKAELAVFNQNPEVDIVYVDHFFMDPAGRVTYLCYDYCSDTKEDLIAAAVAKSPIRNLGVMVRKTVYERVGLYDPTLKKAEDHDLWLRALKKAEFKHLALPLAKRRLHQKKISHCLRSVKADETKVFKRLLKNFDIRQIFPKLSQSEACFQIAQIFYLFGAYDESISYLNKCLPVVSSWRARRLMARIYFRKNFPRAADCLEQLKNFCQVKLR